MKKTLELTQLEANTIATALDLYMLHTQELWDKKRAAHYINIIKTLREQ